MKKLLSLLVLFLFAQPALADAEGLTTCRQVENIEQRVACYDRYVDAHFPTSSSAQVEKSAAHEPPQPTATPDAQSLFGTTDAEAKRIVETSMAIEQISEIEAVVTDVRKSATRKLSVTLDNGQTWRQIDNQPLLLKRGEKVIVRKASLGSFLMEKQSGSRSIRVKRAD